jgi:hypothetical protein
MLQARISKTVALLNPAFPGKFSFGMTFGVMAQLLRNLQRAVIHARGTVFIVMNCTLAGLNVNVLCR